MPANEQIEPTSDDVFKVFHETILLKQVVKSRDLDQPADIVRKYLILDYPFCKFVPFIDVTTVNADPPFAVLPHM